MPLLRQRRDLIEIQAKPPGRCKKYDVVLYRRSGRYILHRILKVLPDGYIIAGDHNTFLEYDITDNDIIGVMTRINRDGREITMDSFLYRCYVHLWCDFYPLRMALLRCKSRIRRLMKRIRNRITQ